PPQDSSGTFVQLRVNLVQTNCRKRAQRTQNCKAVENRVRRGLRPPPSRLLEPAPRRVGAEQHPPSPSLLPRSPRACPLCRGCRRDGRDGTWPCPAPASRCTATSVGESCGPAGSGVQLGTGLGAGWVPAPALTATLCPQRKPACLACYKFDNSDVPKVLDKYHNCGPSHHLAVKVSCPRGVSQGWQGGLWPWLLPASFRSRVPEVLRGLARPACHPSAVPAPCSLPRRRSSSATRPSAEPWRRPASRRTSSTSPACSPSPGGCQPRWLHPATAS
uniref:Uncharacterized protein n=1 Tax=Anser cygnoides TaxID=8845 RepID=A0A8B9DY18_ANSCY